MVAFNSLTQIPNIITIEGVLIYSSIILNDIDTSKITFNSVTTDGVEFSNTVKAVRVIPVVDKFDKIYWQVIAYIPVPDDYLTNQQLPWNNVEGLPNAATSIPSLYLRA
jgi:predicted P-loop ATPase/GTPase